MGLLDSIRISYTTFLFFILIIVFLDTLFEDLLPDFSIINLLITIIGLFIGLVLLLYNSITTLNPHVDLWIEYGLFIVGYFLKSTTDFIINFIRLPFYVINEIIYLVTGKELLLGISLNLTQLSDLQSLANIFQSNKLLFLDRSDIIDLSSPDTYIEQLGSNASKIIFQFVVDFPNIRISFNFMLIEIQSINYSISTEQIPILKEIIDSLPSELGITHVTVSFSEKFETIIQFGFVFDFSQLLFAISFEGKVLNVNIIPYVLYGFTILQNIVDALESLKGNMDIWDLLEKLFTWG